MVKFIGFFFFFALLVSCSTYKTVGITVDYPAIIDLRPEINRVTLVNRTIPADTRTTAVNVLEGIFSGESIMADRLGARSSLNGMQLALIQGNRLQPVGGIVEMKTNTIVAVPPAMTWFTIDSLCQSNGSDMIVACEFFDSDQIGTLGGAPIPNSPNDASANVRAYFRVYDNINRQILSEEMMFYRAFGGGGNLVLQGSTNIERRAYGTGYNFGRMLAPYTNFERRNLFHSGSKSMRTASKLARAGNWESAAMLWAELENSGKRRQAYRATFNLGLSNEISGNIPLALQMVQKSFSMKPSNSIAAYMNNLNIRLESQNRMEQQRQE